MVSTAETSLEIVPVPLKSRTGTAVVVLATGDATPLDVASVVVVSVVLDPLVVVVVVEPSGVAPLVVEPDVVDPVVVVVAVVLVEVVPEPLVVAPVFVDPLGVDVVAPDVGVELGSGTGCALAGVPNVEPGVPHAVKIIGTTAISPKTIARCKPFAERGNETTRCLLKLFLGCRETNYSAKTFRAAALLSNKPEVVLEFLEFTQKCEKGKSQKYMVSCTKVRGNPCVSQETDWQGDYELGRNSAGCSWSSYKHQQIKDLYFLLSARRLFDKLSSLFDGKLTQFEQ